MEPPEYSNCLTLHQPYEGNAEAADRAGCIDEDRYSAIYQDILETAAEGRNQGISFRDPRIETLRKPNKEVKTGRYKDISAKLKAVELDHSTMMANVSKGLLDAQSNHNEIKQHFESDMATLRASLGSLITCPVGWKAHAGNCYYFSSVQQPWESAKVDCIRRGSQLVTVKSKEEQIFLAQNVNGKEHWIGLSDSAQEGTWQWVNGAPLRVSFWQSGEPNNAKNDEDCAEIEPTVTWNDDDCSSSRHWICEKSRF
ncbi:CD209 antigen-like protein C isoform X2 [Pleurodeles waltl]|uniref:CD209 antigen-like protein C isoform X2 n=1 Tax=Pleurodeles waltl TaxID=8319 RepID=UPI0037096CE0